MRKNVCDFLNEVNVKTEEIMHLCIYLYYNPEIDIDCVYVFYSIIFLNNAKYFLKMQNQLTNFA